MYDDLDHDSDFIYGFTRGNPSNKRVAVSVCHTLTPPQRGESNAGVEIPMMALPNDSAIASLLTGGHAVVYFVPGQS